MDSNLIIDNAGFDIAAMSQLTEKEFIDLHKDNEDIKYGKTPANLTKWLKNSYKKVVAASKGETAETEEPESPDKVV